MKKLVYILLAVTTAIVISCSKDQKVVKELEGDWKVTAQKVDNVAQPDSTFKGTTYHFDKCKVKKGDCDGSVNEDGKSFPFKYRITEKGTKFTLTLSFAGTTQTSTADILEHSKTKFVYKSTDNGEVTETTLEKK
jgi:hypothetical protein